MAIGSKNTYKPPQANTVFFSCRLRCDCISSGRAKCPTSSCPFSKATVLCLLISRLRLKSWKEKKEQSESSTYVCRTLSLSISCSFPSFCFFAGCVFCLTTSWWGDVISAWTHLGSRHTWSAYFIACLMARSRIQVTNSSFLSTAPAVGEATWNGLGKTK